jgi:hypothetical protein
MIAYRYIEPKYLDGSLHGIFLLRRLSYYRTIESPERVDPLEGAVAGWIDNRAFANVIAGSANAAKLKRVGITFRDRANVQNNLFVEHSPDYFILSLTHANDARLTAGGRSTVIKIHDTEELARAILAANPKRLLGAAVGEVVYENRFIDLHKSGIEADPFKKGPQFRSEQEVRIVFSSATSTQSILTEPFNTNLIEKFREKSIIEL